MTKFEHMSVVLHFEKKNFSVTRSGVLRGLAEKSATALVELGIEGWELVSVVPYTRGGTFIPGEAGTDVALAFLKRSKV